MDEEIDTNRCCFCGKTIEWQDDWCEHEGVPAEVAHVACCSLCSEPDYDPPKIDCCESAKATGGAYHAPDCPEQRVAV